MGLDYLKNSLPILENNPGMFTFIQGISGLGFASVFIFIAIGMVFTIALRSSNATMALILVMSNNGWFGFTEGAALVLGVNIGTTITANLAGLIGNVNAKRAALSHTVFNAIGIFWMLLVFNKYLFSIDYMFRSVGIYSPNNSPASIPYALAFFHTSFNIINTLLLVGFSNGIIAITKFFIKEKKTDKGNQRIEYLGNGFIQVPELSIMEIKNLTLKYCEISKRMFGFVRNMHQEKDAHERQQLFEKILKYEDIVDKIEYEITVFIINVSNKEVSATAKGKMRRMRMISYEIEKVGDTCNKMAYLVLNLRKENINFSEVQSEHIKDMFLLVEEAFSIMFECVNTENKINLEKAVGINNRIIHFREVIRGEMYENLDKSDENFKSVFFTNKLCASCEKIGENIFNINEIILSVNMV